MKWILAVLFLPVVTWAASGCQSKPASPQQDVTVTVEGHAPFPESLAGRWRADRDGWEFAIEPDGRISSAVISMGRVRVVPGQTTTRKTRSGGRGEFTPGAWTVHYQPDTGDLTVKIVMDHVRVEMGDAVIEGACTDAFSGKISVADGVWLAQWTTFTQYTITRPGQPPRDLSTDQTYGETRPLTFEKVEPSDAGSHPRLDLLVLQQLDVLSQSSRRISIAPLLE